MFCTKCGKEISDGSQFCKYCGAQLTTGEVSGNILPAAGSASQGSSSTLATAETKTMLLWVGIGTAVVNFLLSFGHWLKIEFMGEKESGSLFTLMKNMGDMTDTMDIGGGVPMFLLGLAILLFLAADALAVWAVILLVQQKAKEAVVKAKWSNILSIGSVAFAFMYRWNMNSQIKKALKEFGGLFATDLGLKMTIIPILMLILGIIGIVSLIASEQK